MSQEQACLKNVCGARRVQSVILVEGMSCAELVGRSDQTMKVDQSGWNRGLLLEKMLVLKASH